MATHDYVIDNSTGANVRTDLNNVLQAILTNNSSGSAPSTTAAYMLWADTSNNILKMRNSSNNAWINLFTTAGGVDVDAASNFNEDVTFTGASANIVFDKSDNQFEFADNAKAVFGTGSDLQIYHDGTDSYVSHQGGSGGDLIIQTTASDDDVFIKCNDDFIVNVQGGAENAIIARNNGEVELYYDASKKFETTSTGVQVTGNIDIDGNIDGADGSKIKLGTGDDLQIYHDGTNSILQNNTGVFYLKTINGEFSLVGRPNGATELYYDHSKKFETKSTGVNVFGGISVGSSAANNTINVDGAAGNAQTTLYYGFGTIDLTSASDERVKNNIVPTAKGLEDILKLRIVDFTYTPEYAEDSTTVRTGGIAQEWQKVDPNLVNAENEDLLIIEYKKVIPHLIKAVQELSAKVAALEAA